jgi:Cof subfamily protein (haloacid dehalogenase superfamily)
MQYQAIIFDLDGTAIVNGRYSMPGTEMIRAVHECREKIILCAATGRAWPEAKRVIDALGINRPCIINGGTLIVDPLKEKVLWQETIPVETARKVLEVTKRYPYKVSLAKGIEITDEVEASSLKIEGPINTIYIADVPMNDVGLQKLADELSAIDGITASKALSWGIENGVDLHVTNNEATKEHAIAELCSLLNIASKNVIGVGDGYNDLHLFNAVGYKVAMGNAVDELKEVADRVIQSQEEEGLAKFMMEAVKK